MFEDRTYNLNSISGQVLAEITEFSRTTKFAMTITSAFSNVDLDFSGGQLAYVKLGAVQYDEGTRWTYNTGGQMSNVQVDSDTAIEVPLPNFGDVLTETASLSDTSVKQPAKSAPETLASSDATVKQPTAVKSETLASSDATVKQP
ncbi:MAG: hypothetical protein ACRD38_10550, partial [Nitrososphaerales archaeon]